MTTRERDKRRERGEGSEVKSYIARLCGGRGEARVPQLTLSLLIIYPFYVKDDFSNHSIY